jgi:hypothetical protein
LAIAFNALNGTPIPWNVFVTAFPDGYGHSLSVVFAMWVLVIAIM